ncbi:MAG TPA: extracellular solute-binding protein [Bacillales bacterium]|nr:extracellular solute-binding protein [Bacillales bacterium]
MFRFGVLFLALLLILSGCGMWDDSLVDPAENKDSNKVTLTMVQTFTREDEAGRLNILKKHIHQMEEENPRLTIKLSTVAENIFRNDKLPTAMAVGNPPDIFDLFGGTDTERYAKAGRLLDLTDFLRRSGLKDQFINGALREFTIDGHVYGLPRAGYAEGFFYNKDIFREMDAQVPETWKDFIDVIQKSKNEGYIPIALGSKAAWVPGMILNALIIRHIGIDNFKALTEHGYKWTSPQMLQAWKEFDLLVDSGAFPDNTLGMSYLEMNDLFEKGRAAMVYNGTWSVTSFTSQDAKALKDHLGFFIFPTVSGGIGDPNSINAGFSNGWGFSSDITRGQKQMVHKFIQLTWSKHAQEEKLDKTKILPAIKLANPTGVEPVMKNILKELESATSTWPAYDAIVNNSVKKAFNNEIQKVIAQVDTPEQALIHIQQVSDSRSKNPK